MDVPLDRLADYKSRLSPPELVSAARTRTPFMQGVGEVFPGVRDIRGGTLIHQRGDKFVTATLKTSDGRHHEISSDFVLACDGARSTIREQLQIPMPGVTDAHDWVAIDTVNDPDRDRFSKFFCDPKRPMVSIPAPRGGRSYEFMILPDEDPKDMVTRATIRSVLERFRTIPDEDILRAVF